MIERYNVALDAAQRGNYDLAIHQLARIVAQHPNYVRRGSCFRFSISRRRL